MFAAKSTPFLFVLTFALLPLCTFSACLSRDYLEDEFIDIINEGRPDDQKVTSLPVKGSCCQFDICGTDVLLP